MPSDAIKRLLVGALESLPTDKPFDAQDLFGDVALEIALLFITGPKTVHELSRSDDWADTKKSIGHALAEGQRVMGRRLKVGSIWVSPLPRCLNDRMYMLIK